jgi:hypothetical protein
MTGETIVCTLSAAAMTDRIAEWRRFVEDHVLLVAGTAGSARLQLRDTDGSVLAATDLAAREKACCAFFEFRLVRQPEAVWLEIDAPKDASALLDELIEFPSAARLIP